VPAAGSEPASRGFVTADFGVLSVVEDVFPEFTDGVTTVEGEFGTVTVNFAVAV
jgi:hypothetical protein